MGWFLGFKLHLPINHHGHIMVLQIAGAIPNDRQPLEHMSGALQAKGVGDKGYICQSLMGRLWQPSSGGQAAAEKTIHYRAPLGQAEAGNGTGAQPPPLSHQCPCHLLSCRETYSLALTKGNMGTVCTIS